MTEKQLQDAVIAMCKLFGLHWYHTHDSRHSVRGFPDLFICGRGRALARELKNDTNKPTDDQLQWREWLRRAGIDWDLWRPADLRSGRIQRELEAIR